VVDSMAGCRIKAFASHAQGFDAGSRALPVSADSPVSAASARITRRRAVLAARLHHFPMPALLPFHVHRDRRLPRLHQPQDVSRLSPLPTLEVVPLGGRPQIETGPTQDGTPTTLFSIKEAMSASLKPTSCSTARECSPNRGGMRWIAAGLSENRVEGRACRISPSVG
jgi:hypothetical protein